MAMETFIESQALPLSSEETSLILKEHNLSVLYPKLLNKNWIEVIEVIEEREKEDPTIWKTLYNANTFLVDGDRLWKHFLSHANVGAAVGSFCFEKFPFPITTNNEAFSQVKNAHHIFFSRPSKKNEEVYEAYFGEFAVFNSFQKKLKEYFDVYNRLKTEDKLIKTGEKSYQLQNLDTNDYKEILKILCELYHIEQILHVLILANIAIQSQGEDETNEVNKKKVDLEGALSTTSIYILHVWKREALFFACLELIDGARDSEETANKISYNKGLLKKIYTPHEIEEMLSPEEILKNSYLPSLFDKAQLLKLIYKVSVEKIPDLFRRQSFVVFLLDASTTHADESVSFLVSLVSGSITWEGKLIEISGSDVEDKKIALAKEILSSGMLVNRMEDNGLATVFGYLRNALETRDVLKANKELVDRLRKSPELVSTIKTRGNKFIYQEVIIYLLKEQCKDQFAQLTTSNQLVFKNLLEMLEVEDESKNKDELERIKAWLTLLANKEQATVSEVELKQLVGAYGFAINSLDDANYCQHKADHTWFYRKMQYEMKKPLMDEERKAIADQIHRNLDYMGVVINPKSSDRDRDSATTKYVRESLGNSFVKKKFGNAIAVMAVGVLSAGICAGIGACIGLLIGNAPGAAAGFAAGMYVWWKLALLTGIVGGYTAVGYSSCKFFVPSDRECAINAIAQSGKQHVHVTPRTLSATMVS